jgi:phage terminase Nu1 subunit (DNA packaging protein)
MVRKLLRLRVNLHKSIGDEIMVIIENIPSGECRHFKTINECTTDVERSIYRTVVEYGATIKIPLLFGKLLAYKVG